MVKLFSSKKAQNLTELALLIGIIAIVFIGMEVYIKRGMQSKIKDMTDGYMTSGIFGGGNLVGAAKQEIYEVDTHNYTVQDSYTPTQAGGTINSRTLPGGGKVESSQQNTHIGTATDPATSHSVINY